MPSVATETRVVLGIHPAGARTQVSRTKMSRAPFVSPKTRFVAEDAKATKRPSALIDGAETKPMLSPLSPLPKVPSGAIETATVLGVHPACAPPQVSRRKTLEKPF